MGEGDNKAKLTEKNEKFMYKIDKEREKEEKEKLETKYTWQKKQSGIEREEREREETMTDTLLCDVQRCGDLQNKKI